jgi:hypothetical protein
MRRSITRSVAAASVIPVSAPGTFGARQLPHAYNSHVSWHCYCLLGRLIPGRPRAGTASGGARTVHRRQQWPRPGLRQPHWLATLASAVRRAGVPSRSANSIPIRTTSCSRPPGRSFSTASEDVITRPDLADRALFLILPSISEAQRRPENEIWRMFELARPCLLGALLDVDSERTQSAFGREGSSRDAHHQDEQGPRKHRQHRRSRPGQRHALPNQQERRRC